MGKHGTDGVYDADPAVEPDARFLPEISHREAIEKGLRVMDSTALSRAWTTSSRYTCSTCRTRATSRVVSGERVGTVVTVDAQPAETGASRE